MIKTEPGVRKAVGSYGLVPRYRRQGKELFLDFGKYTVLPEGLRRRLAPLPIVTSDYVTYRIVLPGYRHTVRNIEESTRVHEDNIEKWAKAVGLDITRVGDVVAPAAHLLGVPRGVDLPMEDRFPRMWYCWSVACTENAAPRAMSLANKAALFCVRTQEGVRIYVPAKRPGTVPEDVACYFLNLVATGLPMALAGMDVKFTDVLDAPDIALAMEACYLKDSASVPPSALAVCLKEQDEMFVQITPEEAQERAEAKEYKKRKEERAEERRKQREASRQIAEAVAMEFAPHAPKPVKDVMQETGFVGRGDYDFLDWCRQANVTPADYFRQVGSDIHWLIEHRVNAPTVGDYLLGDPADVPHDSPHGWTYDAAGEVIEGGMTYEEANTQKGMAVPVCSADLVPEELFML